MSLLYSGAVPLEGDVAMRKIGPAALLITLAAMLAPLPAMAADDARCTALPAAVEAALPGASPEVAATAGRYFANGKALCAQRNRRAAADQFRAAARLLGIDESGQALAGARPPAEARLRR
jgi:hypothetical protein